MVELAVLVAAMCVLAVVIDHFRGLQVTGEALAEGALDGQRFRVVGYHFAHDIYRIRRSFRPTRL
jgi:hypothetical protein